MSNIYDTDNRVALSLSELNLLVKETVELTMPQSFWVRAELAGINDARGHCYMELVEMGIDRTPVAQARACCWRQTWLRLAPKFLRATGEEMRRGMKVMLQVRADFHVAYGFSWIVTDVDPAYTMGDMARRRQEIIRRLKEEGVFDLNRQLTISPFCQRIAVISSATAAGYGDFCNQLADNDYGLQFVTRLFPAVMQGEQVEQSVTAALDMVHTCLLEDPGAFDAVVIIRGGGSTADLSGFDTLLLAEYVANFPLPVITGIGHDRDQSVIDLIACRSEKTPTAVAAFLIDNLAETLERINDCAQRVQHVIGMILERERERTSRMEQRLQSAFGQRRLREDNRISDIMHRLSGGTDRLLLQQKNRIDSLSMRFPVMLNRIIERERHRLQLAELGVKAADPVNILRRGYSITLYEGKAVTDASSLQRGDNVTIVMANGRRQMTVSE